MSTHSFHWHRDNIEARWSHAGDCAIIETEDGDINIHAHDPERIERLRRAIRAFSLEMQREPVAQQQAEAVE